MKMKGVDMQKYVSEIYSKQPEDVVFMEKYVMFNPEHSSKEYEATKASILLLGQEDPILMYSGRCIDGRHRIKIAKELGTLVRCIDVNTELSDAELIMMCNKNTTSGRDFTSPQKAIQALKLVTEHKWKAVTAAQAMKVDKRLVSYASTIRGLGREDILDALMNDKAVKMSGMKYASKSLEMLCKFAKVEAEKDVIEDNSERPMFNPDGLIKAEAGKAWFYERKEMYKLEDANDIQMIYDLIELANYKFKTVVA